MPEVRGLHTPISEALLFENQNLAILIPKEIRKTIEYKAFFFRVTRASPILKIYSQELPTLAPGDKTEFKYVGELGLGMGNDIFEILDEFPFRMYHFGIGIAPGYVKLYRQIPAGNIVMSWIRKSPTVVGEEFDYIDGFNSPFDNPTVFSETLIFRKLSFNIALFNDGSISTRPSLKFLGKNYEVIPITERTLIEKMIAGIIPCRFITITGTGISVTPISTPDEWATVGVDLTKAQIEDIFKRLR
jgi:hypothetical protein